MARTMASVLGVGTRDHVGIDDPGGRELPHERCGAAGEHTAAVARRGVVGDVGPVVLARHRRVGEHVHVGRARQRRHVAVVLPLDNHCERLAVAEVAAVPEPRRGVGHHQVRLGPDRLVHGADEARLGVVDGCLVPVDRGERRILGRHRVLAGILVADLQTVRADGARLHPDLAVAGVGAEEGHVDTVGDRRRDTVAHRVRPVLVVTQAEQAAVVGQQARVGVQVDVGPVGQVGTEALEAEEEGELVADEVRRPRGPRLRVRPVERHDAGAVGEVGAAAPGRPVVQAVVAVEVVGLPRRDAVLQDERRHGVVVADGEGDELLLPAVADQLQQVTARRPLVGDADRHGLRPRTGDRAERRHHRRRLGPRLHHVALPNQAAAETLVVPHAVGLHLHGLGRGVDEQGDVVAGHRAHLAGVPLQGVVGLDEVAHPVERAPACVLRDQPGRGGHHHAAREQRVHHSRLARRHGPPGPGVQAVGRLAPAAVRLGSQGQSGRSERGELEELAPIQSRDDQGGPVTPRRGSRRPGGGAARPRVYPALPSRFPAPRPVRGPHRAPRTIPA